MSSGERPIGAAKGKESDTEALCQPPPPPLLSKGLAVALCYTMAQDRGPTTRPLLCGQYNPPGWVG